MLIKDIKRCRHLGGYLSFYKIYQCYGVTHAELIPSPERFEYGVLHFKLNNHWLLKLLPKKIRCKIIG